MVYPGEDCKFTIYEDEGNNYNLKTVLMQQQSLPGMIKQDSDCWRASGKLSGNGRSFLCD